MECDICCMCSEQLSSFETQAELANLPNLSNFLPNLPYSVKFKISFIDLN